MTYVSFLHEGDGELTIWEQNNDTTTSPQRIGFQKKIPILAMNVDGPIMIVPNGYVIVIQH